jgi:hypothetical protein
MNHRVRLYVVGIAAVGVLTSVRLPAAESTADTVHEACGAHQGRCVTVKPPNLPYGPAAGKFKVPRGPDGKPDFTGVYAGPGFTHQVGPNDTEAPVIRSYDAKKMSPLTPLGEKELFRPTSGDLHIDDPIGLCLPYGFTSQIMVPYAQQWIQSPKYLVIRHEFMNNFSRVIPLDGRPHAKNIDLTWGGDSVGHWDGDVLVIDTVGLKEWWFDNPHPKGSLWHSDALHVIERVKWVGPRVVSYDVTMDDPKYFTQPWTEETYMILHPSWNLLEYVCNENDRCSQGHCTESDVQKGK